MTARQLAFICPATSLLRNDYNHVLQHFAGLGHEVTIYSPKPPTAAEAIAFTERVSFSPLRIDRRDRHPFRLLGALRQSWSMGRAAPERVVTLVTMQASILYGLPLRLRNRRTVFLLCGMGTLFSSTRWRYRLLRPLVKRLLRFLFSGRNSSVIVQNSDDRAYVTAALGARDVVLMPGCGVDQRRFAFFEDYVAKERKVILVPARIIVEKGILEAAGASLILTERGIDHEMWFTLDDPGNPLFLTPKDKEDIVRRCPDVRFIGFQEDIAAAFRASDVICLPSYREGLPNALVQAAACGRAIVTTDVEGCREIVRDGETGLLVRPRDSDALADALARMIQDDNLRERLRQNAYRQFLDRFTLEASLQSVLPVYRRYEIDC